ncbi:DNA repair protein RecO [Fusobacterium russii]|uniref:DNA repair protein RecO n=1 Tax=Fusobacterium russii TaxID=854 RepID=UPI0003A91707|nr:DNA repair protein RecO [Fusobacterium russii]
MIFLQSKGIIISKKEIEEADRYITVFLEDFGKVSTLVKGIRKSKRRDKTAVDLISLTDFTFYKKGDKIIISEFASIENYENIKSDIDRLNIVFYIFSVLNQVLVENGKNRKIYNLLEKSLDYLNKTTDKRKNLLLVAYFLYEVIKAEGIISEAQDSSLFFLNRNISKAYEKENEILKVLLNNRIKLIIENENYEIESIRKVIGLLERYINVNLDIRVEAKRFLWGDLSC